MTDQEINEAVARKLGWKFFDEHYQYWIPPTVEAVHKYGDRPNYLPLYTKKIEHVWDIVDYLKATDTCCVQINCDDKSAGCWIGNKKNRLCFEEARTVPMAICKAFLKLR